MPALCRFLAMDMIVIIHLGLRLSLLLSGMMLSVIIESFVVLLVHGGLILGYP